MGFAGHHNGRFLVSSFDQAEGRQMRMKRKRRQRGRPIAGQVDGLGHSLFVITWHVLVLAGYRWVATSLRMLQP